MIIRHLMALLTVAWATALPAAAEQRRLTLDPAESKVRFTLGATLHQVEGSVRLERGEIVFDPDGGPAEGEIVVDATSADTGHEGRDEDMHRKVLESDRFGLFVLRPTATDGAVSSSGPSEIELRGDLEIHGDVHQVTLTTRIEVEGDRVTGTATFAVPYVEWGLKDPSKFVLRVEKVVDVRIELAGSLAAAPGPTEPD